MSQVQHSDPEITQHIISSSASSSLNLSEIPLVMTDGTIFVVGPWSAMSVHTCYSCKVLDSPHSLLCP